MRELATREKIVEFMRLFGRQTHTDVRVYFTGGSTAVLHGWRDATLDIDLRFEPEPVPSTPIRRFPYENGLVISN